MSSEANKDEISKCLKVAEESVQNGDDEKAERFLAKARRMGGPPTTLSDLKKSKAGAGTENSAAASGTNATSPSEAASAPRRAAGRTNKDGKAYTSEQMSLVQGILRSKDYYEILGVPKDAAEDALKKAYKKLALKLHPDKNGAPGAEEAFKKVSKSFQCLNDPQHRAAYNQYGDEERIPQGARHFNGGGYMDAEDLFNTLFGGMQRTQYQARGPQQQQQERNPLMQFLPFIFLVLLSFLSNIQSFGGSSSPQPQFSFKPNKTFRFSRESREIKITYYVSQDFNAKFPERSPGLRQFEQHVEIFYIQNVNSECEVEEQTMIQRLKLAKRYGAEEEAKQIPRQPRPACKELERIKRKFPQVFKISLLQS
eukprot:GEMP01023551.1.p1 GENE.GEMP01023551.1~~GEMP01023551.1.p1  ORF type:complete len:368 (+),score=77.48 GEMP01023551.1:162-1265(+)